MPSYSTNEKLPPHNTDVWMTLHDQSSTAGFFTDQLFYLILREEDGTPILADDVTSQVESWMPLRERLKKEPQPKTSKQVIQTLLQSFENEFSDSKLERPAYLEPRRPIPFFLPLFELKQNAPQLISPTFSKQSIFTSSQLSIIYTPGIDGLEDREKRNRHNYLLNYLWQTFLKSPDIPQSKKNILIGTTYRNPKAAYLYTLQHQSYFNTSQPPHYPPYKHELLHLRETTKTLSELPITFHRYDSLTPETLAQLATTLDQSDTPPGLIILDALTPAPKNGDTIPKDYTDFLYNLSLQHDTSIILLATSLTHFLPF